LEGKASKEDIARLEKELEGKASKEDVVKIREDLTKVELSLRLEIEKSKLTMLRWLFIFWASQIGATIALFELFVK
ncbi:MAG: hypothetical protein L3V56_12000, partial [Candidatus Magnetoovum sp. WYHC-5]|nr:hypothetical protein [Candidatus Magnetoovum sp. WYHC-5]